MIGNIFTVPPCSLSPPSLQGEHEKFARMAEEMHTLQNKCLSGVKKNRKNMKTLKEDLKM